MPGMTAPGSLGTRDRWTAARPEFDRPQLTGCVLEDRWSEAMTDPEIVNGKPCAHLPISVRTA